MDFCAVQCPLHRVCGLNRRERYCMEQHGDIVIAALCTEDDFQGLGDSILNFRADNLIRCIVDSAGYHGGDMKSALQSGFMELDRLVFLKFGAKKHTKLCTVVAIADFLGEMVYTAGVANAKVGMLPSSRLLCSTSGWNTSGSDHAADPILFKFQQKAFENDKYLLIATKVIFGHHTGKFASVLDTRVRAVGLVKACKSIVGRYRDESKTLIVVTLKVTPMVDPPPRHPSRLLDCIDFDRVRKDFNEGSGSSKFKPGQTKNPPTRDLGDIAWGDYSRCDDPRGLLRPLKEGELSQEPEPCTTLEYVTYGTSSIGTIENILVSPSLRNR